MTKDRWIYWHPGDPLPSALPEWCEVLFSNGIFGIGIDYPEIWQDSKLKVRRWPATEAEELAWHWCLAHGCSVPDGYMVVRIDTDSVAEGEIHLCLDGKIKYFPNGHEKFIPHPILRKKEPEIRWVTPTDEHARFRPRCEVRNKNSAWLGGGNNSEKYKLIAVMDDGISRYRVTANGENLIAYEECRVDKDLLEKTND